MYISDYDLNTYQKAFTVEINDNQEGTIKISDFFHFLTDIKGYSIDTEKNLIVIPDEDSCVKVFTFDEFCKEYRQDLKQLFTDFVNSEAYPVQWREPTTDDSDDAQEEAYRDFRNACGC